MKEYRKVLHFYYKNNLYNMFLDNSNKHFFLKYNGKEFVYLTLEELTELASMFANNYSVMNIEKNGPRKIKILPKVLIGGVLVTLSLPIFALSMAMNKSVERIKNFERNRSFIEQEMENVEEYVSYDVTEAEEQKETESKTITNTNIETKTLVVDTYLESERLKFLYIYDMEYLDKVLDYKEVSLDDLKLAIKENTKIASKYKDLLNEYVEQVVKKYPKAELRVFYENLKTLGVIECAKEEFIKVSLSVDASASYLRKENNIYVLNGFQYDKGTWGYQVMFHEFSHALRTGVWNKNDTRIKVQVEGQNYNNTMTAEALNSLFAVSLFDYEERDIAYQLQSNYFKVMLECMDNYTLEDYVNHSLSYFPKKLDEFHNQEDYATVILELISMQYQAFHNSYIKVEPSAFTPIYDYISNMYYQKHINSEMSYEEALKVADTLVDNILFDVPAEYNIDTNYFYECLKSYCENLGMDTNKVVR